MSANRPRTLAPGQQLGPYLIHSLLGVGGMGEVYRARDTRLERDVAIKVLPQEFTSDPDRLARFEREARVLASLSHPNIAGIYGLEESGGVRALALEFVEGLTLADMSARGPIIFHDAVQVALQICEGLEAAHERGIVHRDLKPTNIKLRSDGVVKVLDFGLAKAWEPASSPDLTHSPTITTPAITRMGVILGTAAYMSPEQAKGRSADKRSDIFAFGCVLFEILSGKRAFEGEDVSETLANILRGEPDWSVLPASVPPSIHRLLRRCVEKDRRRRIADIDDVRFELEESLRGSGSAVGPLVPTRLHPLLSGGAPRGAVVVLAVALTGAAAWSLWPTQTAVLLTERVPIPVEPGLDLVIGPSVAIATSLDGRRLIYVASAGGTSRLMLREMDRFGSSVIPGTEGASAPFFSHDGDWVGYFSRGALWKVQVRGGIAQKIAELPSFASGSWGPDKSIVFSTTSPGEGLWRIGADGGTPEVLTTPDVANREFQHSYPHVVDAGTHVVFTVVKADASYPAVLQLVSRTWNIAAELRFDSGGVQHVPTGHLVYSLAGQLMAVPFDIGRHSVTGPSFPIEERIDSRSRSVGQFAVSTGGSGMLVYVPVGEAARRETLVLVDRIGRTAPLVAAPSTYRHPRFSRDGQHLAVAVETDGGSDVWVYSLRRQTRIRLTTTGACEAPVWSSDGRAVSFFSGNVGTWTLLSRPADGSTAATGLLTHEPPGPSGPTSFGGVLPAAVPRLTGTHPQHPAHWMNGQAVLAFTERKPSGERDIWVRSSDGEPVPFLVTPFDESSPVFSPDGRFLAYVSNESGANEVYVQSYPGPGGRWSISSDGGDDPLWSPDGRELIYRRRDTFVAVSVQTRPTFVAGAQERLFQIAGAVSGQVRNFDISPDGRQFVIVKGENQYQDREIRLVRNWFQELRRQNRSAQ